MHKPRIIFFDIDGTLIDMEKSVLLSGHWTLCAAYSKTASCWPSPPGVPLSLCRNSTA